MNKFLQFFFLIYCSVFYAQNLAGVTDSKSEFAKKAIIIDSDSITKVSFNEKFKSKYSNDDFIYETKKAEKNAWDRFISWLQAKLGQLFDFGINDTSSNIIGGVVQTIAVLLVIFVIYLIVKSILNNEGQWIFGRNSDRNIINYEDVEKNLQAVNFEKLIAQSIKNGQNRLSIRYYYLWLLKIMSQREIIEWDIEKTNSDYVYEIKDELFKQEFSYLSYLYNYIWYGEFDLEMDTFEKAKIAFETTIQKLKR